MAEKPRITDKQLDEIAAVLVEAAQRPEVAAAVGVQLVIPSEVAS